MYEKPQYLTPDGYRRLSKNPVKAGVPGLPGKKKTGKTLGVKKLSPESAKLIADAIRAMLRS